MLFWNDLDGEDEILGDGEKGLEIGKIIVSVDIVVVMYCGCGWLVNEFVVVILGDDFLDVLMGKIVFWWMCCE